MEIVISSAVSAIVSELFHKVFVSEFIKPFAHAHAQAANLVFGVTGEVESIRDELRLVQSSMELVEDMEEPGEDKVTWARIAESTLSEVEDIVDIFQSKRARYLRRGALKKTLLWLPLECDRVNLRNKAKKIRDQIQDLSNTRPVQLSNPPDFLAFSPGVQATYHSASIVVSLAMNEISLCLSQKLLMNRQVRKIVEDTRNEFERLHRSILVDLKGETCVDERARAWTDQVKDISHFTYHTFSSFINKMKRKNVFLLLEDDSFGKIIQVIKSRVIGLYKRKWIFGIGYVETNSTSMVSVVRRLSSSYIPISRNYSLTYETMTQQTTKQLEWIEGDLSLMEALFNDVDGIEENVDKRLAVWLEQMRKISEDLREEQKLETLTTRRIITMERQINKKLSDMSERKWTYDIWKIEGRRYSGSSSNRGGLEKISSPILSEPMESLQNEVELMNAMIEDAQSHEGRLDVRLKVWLGQMQDIAEDANELLRKTDRIRCGFSNSTVKREIDIINRRVQWISRRKWLYDIGGIRGRRSTDASGSGKSRQMFVRPVFDKLKILKMLYTKLGGSFLKLLADVELIQRESSLLRALLEDVEPSDKRVKAWLNQVSDVTDEMGAAISYCLVHRKSIDRPKIAKKMAQILDKARDVMERRIKFGIELNQKNEKSASSMNRYLSVAESYTFDKLKTTGRNVNILQAVIERLLVQNEECIVVSVVGIKGIGKTTLAQLIYNNDIVARHFPFHALVSIPSDCYTDENLSRIVEEALSRHWKLEKGGLVEVDYGKQLLIVLDEVRTTDIWDILMKKLKSIFDGRRMALIVTTSDVAVAVHADPKSSHKLQLLNDDDSWALFTQSLIVPEELIERSKKMVVKCGGFPQMIMELRERFTMLGSSIDEWMKVLDTPNLGQGPWETTHKVIKGLPLSLKRCLLYLTQFPTDFEIPLRRLTLLWLAEGILRQWWDEEGLESPESVAERYLTDLADRCLVQVTKRNLHGEVLKCRLPHVLRELLSSGYEKADSKDSKSSLSSSNIRHLVHFERKQDGTSGPFHSCITDLSASGISQYQSVIAFRSFDNREGNQSGVDLGKFLDRCISSRTFLLMRVLDLERVFRPVLPKALGALVLLKYLGLRWTYLESLPSFMSKLLNLQTLDLKHTSISRLPDSIWKMGQLRHLFLDEYYHCRFVRRPSRYSLPHLQTLWNVFIDEDSPVKGGLDSSINLTRLGVECRLMSFREDTMLLQLKAVANWVQNLKDLKSLRLKSFDKCGKPWNIPLETLSGQKKLCSLYLLGRVQTDLVISGLSSTLTELTLSGSGLKDDPMQLLKTLTNLRSLSLFSDSFVGKQMLCSEGFAQLQFLKIWKLENLQEWKVESGALPTLGDLEIRSCKRLKTFPDELQNSKTLQKLNFSDMPEEWDEIRETFFGKHEENSKDKYDATHTPVSIFSPTEAKTVPRRNDTGEPSYGTRTTSENILTSLEIVKFLEEPTYEQFLWYFYMTRIDKKTATGIGKKTEKEKEKVRDEYNKIILVRVEGGFKLTCSLAWELVAPEWLTDATLDCMGQILHKEEREPGMPDRKISYLPMLYASLEHEFGVSHELEVPLVREGLFGEWNHLGMIALPINMENHHYFLLVVSLDHQAVYILDSIGKFQERDVKRKVSFLHESLIARFPNDYKTDITKWLVNQIWVNLPHQQNGYDCGAYVCFFMKHLRTLVPNVSVRYTVNEQNIRIWVAHYIGCNKFNELQQAIHDELQTWRGVPVVQELFLKKYPHVSIFQEPNSQGEPSYGTRPVSGNISASLSAGEPSHYKRTKSDNTAALLSSGAFVQLQILKIRKLDKHEEWNADRAFSNISSCKGNEETMADKYEVVRTPVPILSSIKEKIEMQKLRMSQKLFLKKLASEELEMHPWECPFCGVERESAIHLFFLCTPIKMVWFSNYGVKTDDFSNLSIAEWIDHILTPTLLFGGILPNHGDFIRFSVTLMETIWSWRNKFISGAAQTFHPDMIHKNASSSFTSALYIRE